MYCVLKPDLGVSRLRCATDERPSPIQVFLLVELPGQSLTASPAVQQAFLDLDLKRVYLSLAPLSAVALRLRPLRREDRLEMNRRGLKMAGLYVHQNVTQTLNKVSP